ncbi:MFS transporter [Smaragdicoccus niigatensis]|uniref:MFS transporter n=1 Tax=Smaragdicoccus niigatensis TaxID=359359 RepID=UPI00047755AC|nr:MFS transporter [Smaragdicoccus niigatensis]
MAGRPPDFDSHGQHPGYHQYPPYSPDFEERPRGPQQRPVQPEAHETPYDQFEPNEPIRSAGRPREEAPRDVNSNPGEPRMPKKLTVTRVAAFRSRELTNKGIESFFRAAKADGADKSGLTALTYAVMANFATDAAMAVALANTLFFSAATGEKEPVALFLLITLAPFALIAPLIGPLLDRLQHGRRIALAASFGARILLAVILVFKFHSWLLYPAALGMIIMSKSFSVLKSAVTPRVLPPDIDLVRVNSRLTVFGLIGGTIGAGAIAAGLSVLGGALGFDRSAGALWFAVVLAATGCFLSLRIPAHVEVTEGEVPASLRYHGDPQHTGPLHSPGGTGIAPSKRRQPFGRTVVAGLWGNGTIRIVTGFITLFAAFVAKTGEGFWGQALVLGGLGAAAGIGNFAGNAAGTRIKLANPPLTIVYCVTAVAACCLLPALADNLATAALATLVASGASALAKVSLDACIQDDLPSESIASGFGWSETVMQLSWVIGGAIGVFLPTKWWLGFTVITVIAAIGSLQTFLTYRGKSILPGLGGRRPVHPHQEVADRELQGGVH